MYHQPASMSWKMIVKRDLHRDKRQGRWGQRHQRAKKEKYSLKRYQELGAIF